MESLTVFDSTVTLINNELGTISDQIQDTLQKFARLNHSEDGFDYYYVRLSMFRTESERLDFNKNASYNHIYIVNKETIFSDSALFRTTSDKEQVQFEFRNLYQSAIESGLSSRKTIIREIAGPSPFYKTPDSREPIMWNAPLAVATICSDANVACSANTYSFPSGTTGTATPPVGGYPNYGCLSSQPCPAWFYMQVSVAGNITIFISQVGIPPPFPPQPLDVDFICWGPFPSLTDGCATGLTGANTVDCSYSPNATETCNIPNAQVGEIYILMMTNYSTQPGMITFSQTGGTGVTDCNIVVLCSMIAITTNPSVCDELTNTFNVSGNIEFSNPSPTGTLTITDITAVPPVSQTFTPPFTSPLSYNLTNIPCDGLTHSVTAVFSDSLNCNLTEQFTAPPSTCPHAQIHGGGSICDDGISQTTVYIEISGSPGPYNFTYAINGISQSPVINYGGTLPYIINTNIPGLYTMVSVSNLACPAGGNVTGSATVVLNPLPVPSFTAGENSVCLSIPGKIYTTQAGKLNYTWTIPSQATITAGGTGSDNSVTLTWNTLGNYSISVNYTEPTTQCTAAIPTSFAVAVNPLPTPSFTAGENPVCLNIPGKIYTTQAGKSNYIWTIPPQATITAGGTSFDHTVTLTWNTTGSYAISINYTDPTTLCTAASSTLFPVTVLPTPDLANSIRTDSICDNTFAFMVLTSNVAGTTFTWRAFGSSPNVTGFANQLTGTTLINQQIDNLGYFTETLTYRLLPLANGCAGDSTDITFTVFPTPDLANIDRTDSICDSTFTNINLASHIAGTQFTWRAFGSSPLVTGYSNSTVPGLIINQRLENNGLIPQIVTYRLLPAANGCVGDSIDFVVTVFPTPNLNNGLLTKEICNNNNTNIALTSNVAGTLFTWTCTPSSGNITGYSNSIAPVTQINQNLINAGNMPETVTYHITPQANGCSGWVYHFIVTVIPSPYLTNSPLRKTQCNNQNTNLTLTSNVTGTQFNWTASASSVALTGYSNSVTPGTLIAQTLGNTGFNVDSVTYHITPVTSGCPGSVTDYHVVVFPTPDLSNPVQTASICDSTFVTIPLLSNVSNTTFTWRAFASSTNLTGFSNQTTGINLLNQRIDNTGYTTETVTYRILPTANNCPGDSTDIIITVFPTPNLANPIRTGSICDSTFATFPLTSNITATTFTWRAFASSTNLTGFSNQLTGTTLINQRIDNTGFSTQTVTYRLLPFANGCEGDSIDIVVTVFPTPDLANIVRTESICDSAFTNVNLTSHVTGTQFTWRAFGSSPLVTGYSNNSVPGLIINQRLENNGFVAQTVTYRLLPAANGCIGDSIDFVVTVFPTPNLNNSLLTKEICNNNNTNIALTSNVTGTLFTWTCTPSSGNITGYSNSVAPGILISQNLINTGNTPETVTYNITPHANGCNGWIYHYVVSVIPSPYLTNSPLRKTQCNNQNTNLTLTSNVFGTQFNWTATASSLALTGYSNSVTPGTLISQTLGNTGFTVDSVTYHITPVTSGCPGSVTDYHVVVFPTPDVFFVPNGETVCEGQASGLSLQSHVTGTTYSWTTTASSPNLSGYYNSNGNTIVQTISNSGTTIETVTYHVTPVANSCPPGMTQNVVLTVKPRPAISNTTTIFQICNNTSTAISLQADVPGATFAWRAIGSSPNVSGFSAGSGASIVQTLTNTGFATESVTYRVAATVTGCAGDSTNFIVTVFPVPDVYFTPPSQTICPLQTSNITSNSHVPGATYAWTATGSSVLVTGYSAGSGNLIQQTLNNSGYNIETVTYHVSPTANGCPGITGNVVVTADPAPVVSLTLCVDPVTTTDAQPIKLKGGTPINGTYSGRGVIGTTLYPAVAGAGMDTIFYSYINAYGCSRNNYLVLSIISPLFFTCGNTMTDPRDSKQYPTVLIGTQCWMAANLDYGNRVPSTESQRDNCTSEKYCYNDNPGNCVTSGALYQWDELMKYDITSASQGFCPPGWHIPTEANWNTLFNFYISNGFAGSPLKFTGYSGFNALLNGVRFKNVSWSFNNFATLFWSSTSHGPYKAWAHGMNMENPSVSFYPSARSNAFPVRCIKD